MAEDTLIIAEKPSVAKEVAAWLAAKNGQSVTRRDGYLVVGPYRVSWMFGHLLENIDPHEYDPKFKVWDAAHLPIIPQAFKLKPRDEVDKKTKKKTGRPDPGVVAQLKLLKSLLAEVSVVIGLGDPDQEGQLLQDEFLLWAGNKLPVMRLWLSAIDDASIAKAWKSMKPNSEYAGYYWSALARSHADWLYGINGSRGLTLASRSNGGDALLTLGRVQTPTIYLVASVEKLIKNFKPVKFFSPYITLKTLPEFSADWKPKQDDPRLDHEDRLVVRAEADKLVAALKAAGSAKVTSVEEKGGNEFAPLPFSLSGLQAYMSKAHGFGVQDTLKYAQALYEKKIATYPRVDTEYLPVSQHAEAADLLSNLAGIADLSTAARKANPSLKSKAFDDSKVTAHHAIVPRPISAAQFSGLTSEERLVWLVIAKHYILQFFPAAKVLKTTITLECAGEKFAKGGKVYVDRGWKDVFAEAVDEDEKEEAVSTLPKVRKDEVLTLVDAAYDTSETKPPKRFTEGTLVTAMKNIHKYVVDLKFREVLKENVGIGTEATRGPMIGELFAKGYFELDKSKKYIVPTALTMALIDVLPTQITAPDMTALWQQAMDEIRTSGEAGYRKFIAGQSTWLHQLMKDIPVWFAGKMMRKAGGSKPTGGLEVKATTHKCKVCGAALNHIKGKFGWFFGCSDQSCKTIYKDVGGAPVEKTDAPVITVDGVTTGDPCSKCKKGTMVTRVCGPTTKTPGKKFLACSNAFSKGAAKCDNTLWEKS